jgi:hypothetical protein
MNFFPRRSCLLAAIMLSAAVSVADAQPSRGSSSDERACRGDATKFCRSVIGNDMAVLQCFQARRRQLSPACRAVLKKYGQ